MLCKKCGANLLDTDTICSSCGTLVSNEIETGINNLNDVVFSSPSYTTNTSYSSPSYKKGIDKKYIIIGVIIIAIIGAFFIINKIFAPKTKTIVCTSDKGNISLKYSEEKIVSYKATNGITFDKKDQNETYKDIGTDSYIKQFYAWFKGATSGKCTIDGEEAPISNTTSSNYVVPDNAVTVGDNINGFIKVPSNWTKNNTVDNSVSYVYGDNSITLETIQNSDDTLDSYADLYYNTKIYDGNYGNVTKMGKIIGSYSGYEIYMYNVVTYRFVYSFWFETDDDNIHFMSLEGPSEGENKVTEFLFITETYTLE